MEIYGMTDKGKVRRDNQDTYEYTRREGKIVVTVCDGMGGARGGGIASYMAVESFSAMVSKALRVGVQEPSEILMEAAAYANAVVLERSESDIECRGMGTTLVGAVISSDGAEVVNIGDSRAYIATEGELRRVTRDHSLVEDMVEMGELTREEAGEHPRRNIITRALGVERRVLCDGFTLELSQGDILLFCTDGLTGELTDAEIHSYMVPGESAKSICVSLTETALARGASDNVTVVVVVNN